MLSVIRPPEKIQLTYDGYNNYDQYEKYKSNHNLNSNKFAHLLRYMVTQSNVFDIKAWFDIKSGTLKNPFYFPEEFKVLFKTHTSNDIPQSTPSYVRKIVLNSNEYKSLVKLGFSDNNNDLINGDILNLKNKFIAITREISENVDIDVYNTKNSSDANTNFVSNLNNSEGDNDNDNDDDDDSILLFNDDDDGDFLIIRNKYENHINQHVYLRNLFDDQINFLSFSNTIIDNDKSVNNLLCWNLISNEYEMFIIDDVYHIAIIINTFKYDSIKIKIDKRFNIITTYISNKTGIIKGIFNCFNKNCTKLQELETLKESAVNRNIRARFSKEIYNFTDIVPSIEFVVINFVIDTQNKMFKITCTDYNSGGINIFDCSLFSNKMYSVHTNSMLPNIMLPNKNGQLTSHLIGIQSYDKFKMERYTKLATIVDIQSGNIIYETEREFNNNIQRKYETICTDYIIVSIVNRNNIALFNNNDLQETHLNGISKLFKIEQSNLVCVLHKSMDQLVIINCENVDFSKFCGNIFRPSQLINNGTIIKNIKLQTNKGFNIGECFKKIYNAYVLKKNFSDYFSVKSKKDYFSLNMFDGDTQITQVFDLNFENEFVFENINDENIKITHEPFSNLSEQEIIDYVINNEKKYSHFFSFIMSKIKDAFCPIIHSKQTIQKLQNIKIKKYTLKEYICSLHQDKIKIHSLLREHNKESNTEERAKITFTKEELLEIYKRLIGPINKNACNLYTLIEFQLFKMDYKLEGEFKIAGNFDTKKFNRIFNYNLIEIQNGALMMTYYDETIGKNIDANILENLNFDIEDCLIFDPYEEEDLTFSIDDLNIGYISENLIFVKIYDKGSNFITIHDTNKLSTQDRVKFTRTLDTSKLSKDTELGKFDFTKLTGLHKTYIYHMNLYLIKDDLIIQDSNNFIIVCGFGSFSKWIGGFFGSSSSDIVHHKSSSNGANSSVTYNGKEVYRQQNNVIVTNKMKIGKIANFPRVVWKVAKIINTDKYCIVKLALPVDTIFVRPYSAANWNGYLYKGKGRCNKAIVMSIQEYRFDIEIELPEGTEAISSHSQGHGNIIYRVGDIIYPDSFDETPTECSHGIHVFEERDHVVTLTGDEEVRPLSVIRKIMPNYLDELIAVAESKAMAKKVAADNARAANELNAMNAMIAMAEKIDAINITVYNPNAHPNVIDINNSPTLKEVEELGSDVYSSTKINAATYENDVNKFEDIINIEEKSNYNSKNLTIRKIINTGASTLSRATSKYATFDSSNISKPTIKKVEDNFKVNHYNTIENLTNMSDKYNYVNASAEANVANTVNAVNLNNSTIQHQQYTQSQNSVLNSALNAENNSDDDSDERLVKRKKIPNSTQQKVLEQNINPWRIYS